MEATEPTVRAYLWWEAEKARELAKVVDAAKASGETLGLLAVRFRQVE